MASLVNRLPDNPRIIRELLRRGIVIHASRSQAAADQTAYLAHYHERVEEFRPGPIHGPGYAKRGPRA